MPLPWVNIIKTVLGVVVPALRRKKRLARCPICEGAWVTDTDALQVCVNGHMFDLNAVPGDTGPEPDPNAPHGDI